MAVQPHKIRLEASSYCQLRCPACPNTTHAIQPVISGGSLTLKNFQTLLANNPRIAEVQLANYGEIFLNPELLEIIKHSHERGVVLRATTGVNLNHVKPDVLEGLVRYTFRSLTCSIDGASDETYKIYRVRGNFDRVIDNIRTINHFKQAYGSRYPLLTWQFVIFGHNEYELPRARALARELHMDFRPKLSWDPDFSPIRDAAFVRKVVGHRAASREEYAQKRGVAYFDHLCHQLWEEPQINWDGKILGCARNFGGDFGGNAFTDGLDKSLNSEKLTYARKMLLGKQPPRPDIPCSSCDVYLTRQAHGTTLQRGLRRTVYRAGRAVYRYLRTRCLQPWVWWLSRK